ncbi:UNVERIFIED_CONTAM: putative sucrose-phosphate synthase 2 [Sesamum latifolium]|uniref:Sucrose-phosphate synthase 2 n=1 Tax=Sesamum latifolium TaxID=2727402 RepID=A0AAW2XE28_9LAMI
MQVIPLLASRSQALRHTQDLIMKGAVVKGSEELLRPTASCLRDDIVPRDSPLVAYTKEGSKAEDIISTVRQLSAAGM